MSEPVLEIPAESASLPRQTADRPLHVGDPLPNALGASELMRALNLKRATFYAYMKAGRLKRFEFRRPVSYAKRYSGALVQQYLHNDPLSGKK
jgi:hypothetical protein